MTKALVLYATLEALSVALFAVVFVTRGMCAWAYWALAGVLALNLLLGLALLRK